MLAPHALSFYTNSYSLAWVAEVFLVFPFLEICKSFEQILTKLCLGWLVYSTIQKVWYILSTFSTQPSVFKSGFLLTGLKQHNIPINFNQSLNWQWLWFLLWYQQNPCQGTCRGQAKNLPFSLCTFMSGSQIPLLILLSNIAKSTWPLGQLEKTV